MAKFMCAFLQNGFKIICCSLFLRSVTSRSRLASAFSTFKRNQTHKQTVSNIKFAVFYSTGTGWMIMCLWWWGSFTHLMWSSTKESYSLWRRGSRGAAEEDEQVRLHHVIRRIRCLNSAWVAGYSSFHVLFEICVVLGTLLTKDH